MQKLGDFTGSFADSGDPALRFDPVDPNNFNYNLKIYADNFDINNVNVGTGLLILDLGVLMQSRNCWTSPKWNFGPSTTVFEALVSLILSIHILTL